MTRLVVVGAGENPDAVSMGVIGEPLEHRDDLLAAGDVQLAGAAHEVVLGVDVPKQGGHLNTSHRTLSSRGLGRYSRPTFPQGRPSSRTTSAVKSKRPWNSELPTP